MSDISNLGGVTSQLVKMALDASVMRHQAIANNIANANTPHYTPVRVSFEDQLALHKSALLDRYNDASNSTALKDVRAFTTTQALEAGGVSASVLLDSEMANLARNVVHYQALLEGKAKQGSIIKMAITGGQR